MRSRLPLKSPANDEDPAWLAGEDHKPERLFETPGIESLRSGSMAHEQRILLRIKDGARVYLWVRNANNLHTDLILRNDGARSESSPRGPCVPPAPCEFRLKQVSKKWNFGIYDIF
jgi:hypothetical protein